MLVGRDPLRKRGGLGARGWYASENLARKGSFTVRVATVGKRVERGIAEIHPIGGLAPVGSPTVNEKMAAGLGGSVAIV